MPVLMLILALFGFVIAIALLCLAIAGAVLTVALQVIAGVLWVAIKIVEHRSAAAPTMVIEDERTMRDVTRKAMRRLKAE
jgi:uncharacterized membrane protein